MPLPLFPRLIEWYTVREAGNSSGLLSRTLAAISYFRTRLVGEPPEDIKRRWDVVLLGVGPSSICGISTETDLDVVKGAMGSLFS